MCEYREAVATEVNPLAYITAPCPVQVPAYMTLDAQYGLTDDDLAIGSSTVPEQTVEQEFQAYLASPLSVNTVDILKYWEVSREK
jgi:hypothetical protein